MTTPQSDKALAFKALHQGEATFVMPNAWDAGSAILLASLGFPALATTSGGVNWSKGKRDFVYETPKEVMFEAYGEIAAAVELPVSGDLEQGYGDSPEAVADCIARSIELGMVGGSIEDWTADPAKPLYDLDLAVERIRAARAAADASGLAYTLTARPECFSVPDHPDPFGEAVRRGNLYREAGADCIFVPGPNDAATIGSLVREIDAPISQVVGLGDPTLTLAQLSEIGVRRISTGGSLARACLGFLIRTAEEIRDQGSFAYTGSAIPDPEINALIAGHGTA